MKRDREVPDDDDQWEQLVPSRFKDVCAKGADWEPILHPDREGH